MSLDFKVKQIKPKLKLYVAVLLAGILSTACGGGNTSSLVGDNNTNLSTSLVIEKAATVPVLDGKATLTGVYIHNNTGSSIDGIEYAIANTENVSSTTGATLRLQLDMKTTCTSIAANSSCLLKFTTPNLTVGQSGSALVDASFNGTHSKQLINYRYYASQDYRGVSFSNGSTSLYGTNDYATVYAFVGQSQAQSNVGFNPSNSSLGVSSGLTNGKVDIGVNQVVPLEIHSTQNVTSNLVSLTPYLITSSKQASLQQGNSHSIQSLNLNNQVLQVSISPTQQANLLMSDVPVLTQTESTAIITVMNNGNQPATNSILTSADSTKISVTTASINPCTNGITFNAGVSCNYQINLVDKYNNGSSNLNLNYNNSVAAVQAIQTVYFQNNNAAPMVSVVATQDAFTEQVSTNNNITFNIQNIGNSPLNNVVITPKKTLTNTTLTVPNNTCTSTLAAKSSCQVQVNVAASNLIDSGIIYLNVSGDNVNSTQTSYSFMSKPVTVTITDPTVPTVTSTTPQDSSTQVSTATGISVSFSEAMNPTTLNTTNIQLQKVSDNSSVALTFQSVSSDNQIVTFTLSNGGLVSNTEYKIVIDPSRIKDANGSAIDSAVTNLKIASFTTAVDNVAPTINSFAPANAASNQSKTPAITLTFSEAMDQATLTPSNIMLETQAGVAVTGYTISYNSSNFTATLNLNGTVLADTTNYQLIVSQPNITDVSGNALGSNASYQVTSFTTGDFTAPDLTTISPTNGATGIAVDSPIILTFNESMNISTLVAQNIMLKKASDSSNVTLGTPVYSNGNKTVTFQPSSSLVSGESYNIVINPSAIQDTSGNAMSAATSAIASNFGTIMPAAIAISITSSWSTIMGSAFAINASITGGSSTVTPIVTTVTGFSNATISPASCDLNSATSSSTSCVFIVIDYTGGSRFYANWNPAGQINSTNINPNIVSSFTGIGLNVTATDGATINGQASPYSVTGISGQVTAPYIYLPAIQPGAESATNTGISWGSGGAVSTRFIVGKQVDNITACATGQDTVVDNLTGLMWPKSGIIGFEGTNGGEVLAQPNYANTDQNLNNLTWDQASLAVLNMNGASVKLCGYNDWRLPTVNELVSLVNYGVSSQSTWLNSQGFARVQPGSYWSSSTRASFPSYAWLVSFNNGGVAARDKTNKGNYVWPVRGGQ